MTVPQPPAPTAGVVSKVKAFVQLHWRWAVYAIAALAAYALLSTFVF